jgi:hypothetical protein
MCYGTRGHTGLGRHPKLQTMIIGLGCTYKYYEEHFPSLVLQKCLHPHIGNKIIHFDLRTEKDTHAL